MVRKQVDSFVLNKRIGGGTYGEVWRGHNLSNATTVALRRVHRNVEEKVKRLRNEVRLLRQVSHSNILRFHGLRKSPSFFYLALEYCPGGDLAQLLRARGPLPEAESWRYCVQITAGLLALHCEHFVHGNLQPRSVLLSSHSSEDPKLKLANFTCVARPNPYTAPEVLRGEPCDGQADMWSAGAILYEMLFGRPPFYGNSRSQLLASHFSREVSFAEERVVTGEGQAFCQSLLGRHCSERPSSSDCARHTYIKRGPLPSNGPRRQTSPQAIIPRSNLQVSQLAQMWPLCSSAVRLACARIAQRFFHVLHSNDPEGMLQKNTHENDGEVESSQATLRLGPGGLYKSTLDTPVSRDPVTYFVVGQLQYSHFFRFRTARMFPRILYAI